MVWQADTRSMRYAAAFLVLVSLVAIGLAGCGDDDSDELVITDAYVTASSAGLAALYFTVDNGGDADTLIKVTTDVPARATFHHNVVEGANARMEELPSVDIPAHGTFHFEPADHHVMLDSLEEPLEEGDKVTVTAHFEHAGEHTFEAEVRGVGSESHDEHDEHGSH